MTLGWKGLYFTMIRVNKGHREDEGISQELFHKNIYFLFHILQTEIVQISLFFLKWPYCQSAEFPFSK